MSRLLSSWSVASLALMVCIAVPAHAQQSPSDGNEPRGSEGRPGGQPQASDTPQLRPRDDGLSDSVRRVERSTRGQVLSAEHMQSDGRDLNRIKIKDDRGRVRVYMDDPQQPVPRSRDDDD